MAIPIFHRNHSKILLTEGLQPCRGGSRLLNYGELYALLACMISHVRTGVTPPLEKRSLPLSTLLFSPFLLSPPQSEICGITSQKMVEVIHSGDVILYIQLYRVIHWALLLHRSGLLLYKKATFLHFLKCYFQCTIRSARNKMIENVNQSFN